MPLPYRQLDIMSQGLCAFVPCCLAILAPNRIKLFDQTPTQRPPLAYLTQRAIPSNPAAVPYNKRK